MATDTKPIHTVSVRELVEFVLRRGDLGGARDFVGADRALAGTRGHQRIQRSRPSNYRREVPVSRDVGGDGLILRVQGRIDGVLATGGGVLIEEIKTVRGGWDRLAHPLHWAQARLYAFIYAEDQGLANLQIRLVYLDLDTGEITEFAEPAARSELGGLFHDTTATYLEWVQDRHRWCQVRDQSIRALPFPFARYRTGQREIAVAAYRSLVRGGRLFVEAPTGIGKTVGVLFPALKALAEGKLERIFYLTARTVGRTIAEQALAELREAGLRLRTVTLTARDKLCVQDGRPCDPGACPLARGYYDRRHAAMREALEREGLTRPGLETVSQKHQVCPFELSLDVSLWVDAIVGDYNHGFDPRAYLRRHLSEEQGAHAFLVDEAHNLVDRAREMFSAELSSIEIRDAWRRIQSALPRCAKALKRLHSALRQLGGNSKSAPEPGPIEAGADATELDLFSATVAATGAGPRLPRASDRAVVTRDRQGVSMSHEAPEPLARPIADALAELEGWLAQNRPAEFRPRLIELYFRLLAFRRTVELFDERFVTLIESGAVVRARLFCLDPSHLLRQALDRARGTVFFSATLAPADYYRSLLGGDPDDPWLRMGSPFPAEHLAVLVHDRIRTQLAARSATLADVVEAIGALVEGEPGNYLAYFPSYQYLAAARESFQSQYPAVTLRAQHPGMSEAERATFLATFRASPGTTQVGFAVLGGVFGEGIDLVGDRLIGVVVVGVGLPQLCVERDLIRDHFQAGTGAGFDYAYTFPGMNRVLQAVGRVIRSESDRGVVLLVDARFGQERYRRLFPAWWRPARVGNLAELRSAVGGFWTRPG